MEKGFFLRPTYIYPATESVQAFTDHEILTFLEEYSEGQRFDIPELNTTLTNGIRDAVLIIDNSIHANQKIIKAVFHAVQLILTNFSTYNETSLKKLISDVGRALLYHNNQEISVRRKNIKNNLKALTKKMLKDDDTGNFLFEISNERDPKVWQYNLNNPYKSDEPSCIEPVCQITEDRFQEVSQHDASSVYSSFYPDVLGSDTPQIISSKVEDQDQHASTSYQTTQHSYGNEEYTVAGQKLKFSRSKNIILSGVPEEFSDEKIRSVLGLIDLDKRVEHMHGRFGETSLFKNRLYRVTLKSEKDVDMAVNESRTLPLGIRIKRDLISKSVRKFDEPPLKRPPIEITLDDTEHSPNKKVRPDGLLNNDRVLLYYQNVRSLNNKLTNIASQSLQSADVLIFTETWSKLNTNSAERLYDQLDIYNIFLCERSQRGGGVLIAMKNKFFAKRIHHNMSVECIIVQTLIKQKKIILCAVYLRLNSFGEYSQFLKALDLVAQAHPDHELIVIGDFNISGIRWENVPALHCRQTQYVRPIIKQCADEICDFFSSLGFHQIVQPRSPEVYTLDLLFSPPELVRESNGNIIFPRDENHPPPYWFEITA